jgi:hypothetical protein
VSEQTVPAKVTNEEGVIVIKNRFAAIFLAMTLGICSMPEASDAQQPRKIPRVAFFVTSDCADKTGAVWQAFEHGLRESGYNIGQNLVVDCRSFLLCPNATISFGKLHATSSVRTWMSL